MDKAVAAHFGPERFVTAIVAELDVATGLYRWVTCGHPPALLLRRGRIVKTLNSRSTFRSGCSTPYRRPRRSGSSPGPDRPLQRRCRGGA
jgi:hypothetical protein